MRLALPTELKRCWVGLLTMMAVPLLFVRLMLNLLNAAYCGGGLLIIHDPQFDPSLTGRYFTRGTAQDIVADLCFYSQFVERVAHCANDEQVRMGINKSHAGNVADRSGRQQKSWQTPLQMLAWRVENRSAVEPPLINAWQQVPVDAHQKVVRLNSRALEPTIGERVIFRGYFPFHPVMI